MLKKVRDSNYELLRVISMMAIVMHHSITHGQIIENTSDTVNFIFTSILLFCLFHVNCYALITGYYQFNSKFKLKKIIDIIFQVFFYNLLFNIVFKYFGIIDYSTDDFLHQISPFNLSSYWFIKCYIGVYVISPFLNNWLKEINRATFKKIILLLFCFISIFPVFTNGRLYSSSGFGPEQIFFMYVIGAYIRKYDLNKNLLNKLNISQKRFVYFSLFLIFFCFNLSSLYFFKTLKYLDSEVLNDLADGFIFYNRLYNNPLIVLYSVSLFLFFGTFNFRCKFINYIGSLTLGIYLVHQSYYVKNNLYVWLGIDLGSGCFYGLKYVLKTIIITILIFLISGLIEQARIWIFRILGKIKINRKIYNYINKFLIDLNDIK